MNCLTQEQIAQLAVGPKSDADDGSMHVECCSRCRAKLAAMYELVERLSAAHAPLDRQHAESRERLLSHLVAANRPTPPVCRRQRPEFWQGGLTMKQGVALGFAVVFGAIALGGVWMSSMTTPVSAMEQMAASIRKAKSYRVQIVSEVEYVSEPGQPAMTEKWTATMYALATGAVRTEYAAAGGQPDAGVPSAPSRQGRPARGLVAILSADRSSILIDHYARRYRRGPVRRNPPPAMILSELSKYCGLVKRELGVRETNGQRAQGFVIDCEKVSGLGSGEAEIWIDEKSRLPIAMKIERNAGISREKMQIGDQRETTRLEEFQWNIDLDSALFETTPPAGYTDDSSSALPGPVKLR